MPRLLTRFTYANVVATLALFLALGGGAYAAAKLPRDSVSSKTIRDGAIRAQDLHAGAIGAAQIKDKSIGVGDLAASVRNGLDGSPGARGPAGATGATGQAGANGAACRDGAGIVASRSWGAQTIPKYKTVDLGTITWTQPPNTLDEVRGWANVPYDGGSCYDGQGPSYMLVLDGREISPDDVNEAPDGEGTLMPFSPSTKASNVTPVGAEVAAEPSPTAQTHTLQVILGQDCLRNQGNGVYGGPVAVESLRLYVVRNSG